MRSILTSSERYCSEIRKITRPDPAESNETTLWYSITIVRIFSFSTKVAPIQSIVYIALLSFLINAAPLNVYFTLHYDLFSYLFICQALFKHYFLQFIYFCFFSQFQDKRYSFNSYFVCLFR